MTLSVTAAPLPERQHSFALFMRRIWALALRHVYLYIGSWPRLIETLFWPIINMLMLGFASLYLLRNFTEAMIIAHVFVAGALLNEIMQRSSMGMMVMFLEEIWSRNLGHLFASPLGIFDYIIGLLKLSFIRALLSVVPAIFVADYLFHFSLFNLGWPLLAYSVLLIMTGWWYGMLVMSLLLRFGVAAEWMAWMSLWLIVPLAAPYYPVDVLPSWIQWLSWSLPPTYIFESMKSVANAGPVYGRYLLTALVLNAVYFVFASLILQRAWQGARKRGGLLQVGE